MLRAATSVGANIAEARSSSSKKRDFTNFYAHSRKSANESIFWLSLLRDSGKASEAAVKVLLEETLELAKILGSSIKKLKAGE